ncbi:MAG: DUF5615 family PIN-like protein [Sulfuritalea sp.]|jgi:predicted nuclease of predicted toxin-antitoxin system|nr:DUF5615 family PIN-like protein [Sulfuritalea sp.]
MSLRVDNQLPVALARHLGAQGWECIHVRDVGLDPASGHNIWEYEAGSAVDRGSQ